MRYKYIKVKLEEKTHKAFKGQLSSIGANMQEWIEVKIKDYIARPRGQK